MAMSKKDFIALADAIKWHNTYAIAVPFTPSQIEALAKFCKMSNSNFMQQRWIDYIDGACGPNGGAIKKNAA